MNNRRLILFLGKGGVGKTLLSTAYANECAKQGKKTLLLSLYTSEKVSKLYGKKITDRDFCQLRDNLFTVTVTPDSALEEYVLLKLKLRLIYRAVFENRFVSSFLDAIPGLNDLVMLGKAYWHTIEKINESGEERFKWDKVIVDAPATGHGIFFLRIPAVVAEILSSGNMYEEALRMQRVISDRETTELNLITLPEEMPINESLELIEATRDKLHLDISHLIVNALIPSFFDYPLARSFIDTYKESRKTTLADKSLLDRLVEAARFRLERQDNQRGLLDTLNVPIAATIPYFFERQIDLEVVDIIGELLNRQLDACDNVVEHAPLNQTIPPYAHKSHRTTDSRRNR